MRIRYLRLPAFGIFTEQAVSFAPERGLHLIYGPNEAGKSTLLTAIGDALFGIPRISPHAFQHKPASLRIVMGLQLADGQELAFIRRKGNKNTISDLDGNTLPDDLLASYLAGLRRPEFEDMFGLDHLRLREGGQRLLESGGEFSQSLFEAASGLRHLRETFQELEEKARSLYLPQGQNPAVNQLMSACKEQKKAAEAVGLSAQAFEELEARYQQEQEELAELARRVKEARSRQAKLQRIQRTKPLLTQGRAQKERLRQLGPLPSLPAGSAQLYQDLTTQLHSAEQQEKTVEGQIRELEAQLAELDIPEELLAQGETVADLFSGLGKYQEWVDALPGATLTGTVDSIGLIAHSSGGITTVPVTIRLDESPAELRVGYSASVTIEVARAENVLKVPVEAVVSVRRNEYIAIMGPSGSGKSTLLHILGCLDRPTSGDLTIEGTNVLQATDNRLAEIRNRRIGFVFQNFNLMARATALENVELPLIYGGVRRKERRERALAALERVGLADRLHHRPTELSGGQRQRVAIARSLVTEPAFILADEPTGSLDSKTSVQIMELFAQLHQEGNTLLVITHNQSVAQEAQRIIELLDGRITSDSGQQGVGA